MYVRISRYTERYRETCRFSRRRNYTWEMIRTNIEHLYESTFLDEKCKQKRHRKSWIGTNTQNIYAIYVYATAICTQSIPEEPHTCDTNTQKIDMKVEDTRFSVRSHICHTYAAAVLKCRLEA